MNCVDFADVVGIVGVGFILISYFFLQAAFIKICDFRYSLINAIGALLILYSLYFHWNTSSVVIEIFWFTISIYGVLTRWPYKKAL